MILHLFKDHQRVKVLDAVKKLGYKPNIFARKLAGGKLNAIGLIMPGFEGVYHSFYAQQIMRDVALGLDKYKRDLFLHIHWDKDNFNTSYVEGVIFSDIIKNESQLMRLIDEKIPCVVINKNLPDLAVSSLSVDNKKAAYDLTKYLIDLGHKKIAHITGDINTQCARERMDGFKQSMLDHAISLPEEFIAAGNFSRESARIAAEKLINLSDRPTAIFCASDDMAYETLIYLNEIGVRVPEEISLVGFDNNPQYFQAPVRLTSVEQPIESMCARAVELLEHLISGESENIHEIIPAKLIIGDSVASI